MAFVPHHQIVTAPDSEPDRRVFLLHGIYGSLRNWKSFAIDLAAANPRCEVVLVDLRNHGASQGAPPPHTLRACADDLAELARALGGAPEVVIGHSFGGKVAITYAQLHGAEDHGPRDHGGALRHLIVLDSPPGRGRPEEPTSTEAGKVLAVMKRMPLPVASRAVAAREIAAQGVHAAVAQWMATNLRPVEGGYAWHFDLDALDAMLRDYWEVDGWPVLESPPRGLVIDIVRAARSDRFAPEDIAKLEELHTAGKLRYHVLEDAGHWLHVDNPKGLLGLLTSLLSG